MANPYGYGYPQGYDQQSYQQQQQYAQQMQQQYGQQWYGHQYGQQQQGGPGGYPQGYPQQQQQWGYGQGQGQQDQYGQPYQQQQQQPQQGHHQQQGQQRQGQQQQGQQQQGHQQQQGQQQPGQQQQGQQQQSQQPGQQQQGQQKGQGRSAGGGRAGKDDHSGVSADDFFAKRKKAGTPAAKGSSQKEKDREKPQFLPEGFELESTPAHEPAQSEVESKPAAKLESKPASKEEPKKEKPTAVETRKETEDDWENQADEEAKPKEPKPNESAPKEEEPNEAEPKEPEPSLKNEAKANVSEVLPKQADKVAVEELEAEQEEVEEVGGGAVQEEVVSAKRASADDSMKEPDPRQHMNVVFIGHVDAGKSTTCGNILYLCGCVDERAVEKYQKEAKDKNRESWFLAYIMDTNEEEKEKGKTVEVGRAKFELADRRFTILDAPGHKSYVPNMIQGASQADIGVLIISARKGEFETGFERGGQTREHAQLARTLGVEKLVIAVNKMDDPSVQWAESRFNEIKEKLATFIRPPQFKDVTFLPISGLTGDNIKDRRATPSWWKGGTLFDLLNSAKIPERDPKKAFRIPMLDGFKDMGSVVAMGKVEQGTVKPGTKCIISPIGHKCTIVSVFIDDEEMKYAGCGENISLKMHGVSEDELKKGYVLCPQIDPVRAITKFKAQLQILELPEERPVLTAGYKAVIHAHVAIEECEIFKLYESTDPKKKPPLNKQKSPSFIREGMAAICSISLARPTAVDIFSSTATLGRFTLRDEGRTIAIGRITELAGK